VALTFDREAEKVVQVVKPKTTGKPLLGRVDVEYEPKVVTLRGPRLRLIDKETVTTEPVDVDGRVQSFTRTVRVLPPGDTWVSQIDPAEITVRVNILTRTETRVREALPVQAMISPELGAAVRFTPPSVSVTLEGRAEELDALDEEKLKVFVDCGGLEPWCDYELPVRVHLPPGTDVAATVEPATVHVFLGGI
jgi:YbbR domain-containing protein